MSRLLKGSSDDVHKLEWLRDLVLNELSNDKQMVLTALRWALEFTPARVDALEHELLEGIFSLVAELYGQQEAHPAVKVGRQCCPKQWRRSCAYSFAADFPVGRAWR